MDRASRNRLKSTVFRIFQGVNMHLIVYIIFGLRMCIGANRQLWSHRLRYCVQMLSFLISKYRKVALVGFDCQVSFHQTLDI